MNAIFHSLLISAAIVLLWYLWEKFCVDMYNDFIGVFSLFLGEEAPDIVLFILPWLGVAALHYFVPTFWFCFVVGIVTLLFPARMFRGTVVWWIVLFSFIGVAIWHTQATKAEPPARTTTDRVPDPSTIDPGISTNQLVSVVSNATERTVQP